jgi:hypothetical protein
MYQPHGRLCYIVYLNAEELFINYFVLDELPPPGEMCPSLLHASFTF